MQTVDLEMILYVVIMDVTLHVNINVKPFVNITTNRRNKHGNI